MKKCMIFLACALFLQFGFAQNVGIGVTSPVEKLEVNGTVKANALAVSAGNQYDVLKKGSANQTSFVKGSKGVGLRYIIAIDGMFPAQGTGYPNYTNIFVGEIRLFAGNFAPVGFMFCEGQVLPIVTANFAIFSLIGTTYGGNGTTNFALPDLRGVVPVGSGTPASGAAWTQGEVN